MPEGPEIRRSADKLANALVGRKAQCVFFAHQHLKPFEGNLAGKRVTSVTSRGKAILVRFQGGTTVYSHNQLYGRWYVRNRGDDVPATSRQLRLAIHNSRESAFLFSASDIEVLDTHALDAHRFLSKLGPDLLDRSTTHARVVRRFTEPKFQRRALASLLLDQGFLAGTGNYLRSEILFHAGLAPQHKPAGLDTHLLSSLASKALEITGRSYRTGGITNDPKTVARLKRGGVPWGQYRHSVFGRDGQPCFVCGSTITRANLAGRRLYWCSQCQQ